MIKTIPNGIFHGNWSNVFREDCWNITLPPLPRTPGKSRGKQIGQKAFGMLHQACWSAFEQYPISLAIQWNGNKRTGMQCWPTKQKVTVRRLLTLLPNAKCHYSHISSWERPISKFPGQGTGIYSSPLVSKACGLGIVWRLIGTQGTGPDVLQASLGLIRSVHVLPAIPWASEILKM